MTLLNSMRNTYLSYKQTFEKINKPNVKIYYGNNSVRITNSYLIAKKFNQMGYIVAIKRNKGCPKEVKNRSNYSLYYEWEVHNLLYKLRIFRSNTKDVDFAKENKYIQPIYNIIGFLIQN